MFVFLVGVCEVVLLFDGFFVLLDLEFSVLVKMSWSLSFLDFVFEICFFVLLFVLFWSVLLSLCCFVILVIDVGFLGGLVLFLVNEMWFMVLFVCM